MSFDGCYQHTPVIDSSSGTIVCCECAHVLAEQLTCIETNVERFSAPNSYESPCEKFNSTQIDELLNKIGECLHMCKSSIQNASKKYQDTKSLIKEIISTLGTTKNKRSLLLDENLAAYSIYTCLKEEGCPRSIREICYFGNVKPSSVFQIEKFIQANKKPGDYNSRLPSITPKDIILTHYLYIDGMTFQDTIQIIHRLNCMQERNTFTPLTTAAGAVYLYMNHVKNCKITLAKLADLFKLTTMSIRRFVKQYKNVF